MQKYISLFFKGIIIGFGKIIPGVSGSLLAISLGVYEEALFKIRYFFHSLKENVYYFTALGLGVLLSISLGSKLILYFLNKHYVVTMALFIGLLLGIIPSILKKSETRGKKYYLILGITMILLVWFLNLNHWPTFVYKNTLLANIRVFIVGFLEAFTMIVPGISGTAAFMVLGYYPFLMTMFSNPLHFFIEYPLSIIFFFTSFIISVYFVSLLMNYLLHKKASQTYAMIEAFGYVSIFTLCKGTIQYITSSFQILSAVILLLIGFFLSKKIE